MTTYQKIIAAEAQVTDPTLRDEINTILADVEDNAGHDAADKELLRSLETALSFTECKLAPAWFRQQGFTW